MDAARLAPDAAKAARDAPAKPSASLAPGGAFKGGGSPAGGGGGVAAGNPLTSAFPAPGPELADALPLPHVPRAGAAVSAEAPNGSVPPAEEAGMTVLERHVAWFDRDGDGVIWPRDTFRGFYEIGFHPLLSAVAVAVIHLTFSFWTSPSLWSFLAALPFGGSLHVSMMDRGLHGSDARVYDTEGRFRAEAFESIFSKYGESSARLLGGHGGGRGGQGGGGGHGGGHDGARGGVAGAVAAASDKHDVITWSGALKMISRNRSIMDPTGWAATSLEWGGLYFVAADHARGFMAKEDVRAMYDGSLWPRLAARTAARRGHGGGGGGRAHAA